jgi:hypothetical protein
MWSKIEDILHKVRVQLQYALPAHVFAHFPTYSTGTVPGSFRIF